MSRRKSLTRRFKSDPDLQPVSLAVVLIKMSHSEASPSWEKEFPTEQDAAVELRKWVCKGCLADIAHSHNINDLLGTACGCEFWLEDKDDVA